MEEEAVSGRPERDFDAERLERDAFILLQHLFNLSGADPEVELEDARLAGDLAFERPEVLSLIDHLVVGGYLRVGSRGKLSVTSTAVAYIEHEARNRRSVRYQLRSPPLSGWARWRGNPA